MRRVDSGGGRPGAASDAHVDAAAGGRDRGRRDIGPLLRLLRFAMPYRLTIVGALVALVAAAGSVLVIGVGLRFLIDDGFASGDPAVLDRALIWMALLIVVLATATFGRYYLVSWIGERVAADLRQQVFDRTLALGARFYETTRTGEVLSRLTTDTTLIQSVIGSAASIALRNLLLLIGGMVLLIITSAKLTGLVVIVTPLVLVPVIAFGRRVRRLSRSAQDRVADVGDHVEETLNAIRTVQAFAQEERTSHSFAGRVEEAFQVSVDRIRARAFLTAAVMILGFGAVGVILWLGGRDVVAGRVTAGELSAFVFYALLVAGSLGALSEVWGELQRAAGAAERLLDLMAEIPEIAAPATPAMLPSPLQGRVELQDVTFRYPARPDMVALSGIDLTLEPGERVAVVGPSGAGKTTLFLLLQRFYDIDAGEIRIDGVPIRSLDPRVLRRAMAIVPQEPMIFSTTIAENIRYARADASDADVRAAAAAAAIDDVIEGLPEGYATHVGQKGIRLSGGQRQRIAIARAVLADPAILLLDEATSALDSESERRIQEALSRLSRGRTTLTIAHRLSTVMEADRIVVLDNGRIDAIGRHADLERAGGLYARLARLQFGQGGGAGDSQGEAAD